MTPRYAADTEVTPEKSRAEIERTLTRYGATGFLYGWTEASATVQFRTGEEHGYRHVRFVVPLPQRAEIPTVTRQYHTRTDAQIDKALDQLTRQRWRALALFVKAQLEAVESGIVNFDEGFMPFLLLPSGETVGEWLQPQIEKAYADREMPAEIRLALPAPS